MSSKLLHAIVGVGISLGATNTGCFGQTASSSEEPTPGHTGMPGPADPALDPFCDMAWPATKGTPEPPVECVAECVPEDRELCSELLEAPHHCGFQAYYPHCVQGQWQCRNQTTSRLNCRCWGPGEANQTCTEEGWVSAEPGGS